MHDVVKDQSLLVLFLIRFLNSVSNFLLMVMLALLFLEAPFHYSPPQIAFLMSVLALSSHGLEWACSFILLKWNERNCLVSSGIVCGLSLAGLWMTSDYSWAILFLVLYGFSFSLASLCIRAFLASIPDEKKRRLAFGRQYWIINVAAGIAPIFGFTIDYRNHPEIIFFTAILFLLMGTIVSALFITSEKISSDTQTTKNRFQELITNLTEIKRTIPYYIIIFLTVYFLFQTTLLPYYFKTFSTVPSQIGLILALNPVLIIFFQNYAIRLSEYLHTKGDNLEFLIGIAAIVVSTFTILVGTHYINLFLFVTLQTGAEMLIFSNIDFAITRQIPKSLHVLFLSFTGAMIALGRAIAEGFGIWGLSQLNKFSLTPSWWWGGHIVIFLSTFLLLTVIWRPSRILGTDSVITI